MYLKSLTLKGFKSFASATTLQLEPGITCIVGPNGSGKSNVVDALAWVMGEQGAKSLRGGKMEDVIFAGTAGRAPLGRAEVALTIDNSDGALPIEYAEVTISRTMFRNGGSEYAINGSTCRLLDVQELLSDSGIGREMHVIVGQGQLDTVLHATPEDRRGFIEEAAGVLKHRKRKEKALRKLESTDGNLTRLQDLLTEIRRQLGPLGRQAEVARQAQTVQLDARDARARLLADDLVQARQAMESDAADESALLARRTEVETAIGAAREQEAVLEAALREDLPALAQAQDTLFQLGNARERLRGLQSLAAERQRNARSLPAVPAGRDPEELESEAAVVAEQEAALQGEVTGFRTALDAAVLDRQAAEAAHAEEERRLSAVARAAADRREGLARLTGQVNALKSRAAAAEEEVGRLDEARTQAEARARKAQHDFTALETQVAGLDAGEESLDAEYESAAAALEDLESRLADVQAEASAADREKTALGARKDALEMGLDRKDGAGALLGSDLGGVLGSVASLVSVNTGYEAALAAALGTAADAVVVADAAAAVAALGELKASDLGRAGLLFEASPAPTATAPPGSVLLLDAVTCPPGLRAALTRLVGHVVVVETLEDARKAVAGTQGIVAVTREGDIFGTAYAHGGSSSVPSLIEVQAAVDETAERLKTAVATAERAAFALAQLEAERKDTKARVDVALARLHESDARLAAVAEELGHHGATARAARGEAERLAESIEKLRASREEAVAQLADLEERLARAEEEPDTEPDLTPQVDLAAAAAVARQAELEARLALRTAEERARALHGRSAALLASAQAERVARAEAIAQRERLMREGAAAEAVALAVATVLARVEVSIHRAGEA